MNSFEDVKCWSIYNEYGSDMELITNIVKDFTTTKFNEHNDSNNVIAKQNIGKIEKSIKELVGNIVEHAYPQKASINKHWVLFVKYEKEDGRLILVLSDSGKSIPITFIQYHKKRPNIADFIKKNIKSDKRLIQAAIKYGSTGTNKEGRGSGLAFVRESIINYGGNMIIYSKRGCYSPSKSDYNANSIKLYDNIVGTVININLPIQSLI